MTTTIGITLGLMENETRGEGGDKK